MQSTASSALHWPSSTSQAQRAAGLRLMPPKQWKSTLNCSPACLLALLAQSAQSLSHICVQALAHRSALSKNQEASRSHLILGSSNSSWTCRAPEREKCSCQSWGAPLTRSSAGLQTLTTTVREVVLTSTWKMSAAERTLPSKHLSPGFEDRTTTASRGQSEMSPRLYEVLRKQYSPCLTKVPHCIFCKCRAASVESSASPRRTVSAQKKSARTPCRKQHGGFTADRSSGQN